MPDVTEPNKTMDNSQLNLVTEAQKDDPEYVKRMGTAEQTPKMLLNKRSMIAIAAGILLIVVIVIISLAASGSFKGSDDSSGSTVASADGTEAETNEIQDLESFEEPPAVVKSTAPKMLLNITVPTPDEANEICESEGSSWSQYDESGYLRLTMKELPGGVKKEIYPLGVGYRYPQYELYSSIDQLKNAFYLQGPFGTDFDFVVY